MYLLCHWDSFASTFGAILLLLVSYIFMCLNAVNTHRNLISSNVYHVCVWVSLGFFFICIHRNIFAKDESHFHESDMNSCSTENNIPNSNWTIRICVFVRQRAISRNLIDSLQIYLNANINLRVGFGFGFEPKIHWVKCLVRLETVKWWQPAILSKITSISHSQSLDCCWLCCCLITKSFCTLAVPFCPKNFLEQ